MNFSPFGSHFPASIPIHQFAAKFTHDGSSSNIAPQGMNDGGGGSGSSGGTNRYHTSPGPAHFTNQHHAPIGMPVNMGKYNRNDNTSSSQPQVQNMLNTNATKYLNNQTLNNSHHYGGNVGIPYSQAGPIQQNRPPTSSPSVQEQPQHQQTRQIVDQRKNAYIEMPQDLCAIMMRDNSLSDKKDVKQEEKEEKSSSNDNGYGNMAIHHQHHHHGTQTTATMPATWQSLAAPGSTVADYLSHLPASTLPISLHHFLKYSAENIKKEVEMPNAVNPSIGIATTTTPGGPLQQGISKKKKKKKPPKEKKPRPKPGEIRLTTALDGSTLYCCPECHMAYPDKDLLEQHLLGHTLERRFVCDICGAGLKRKDHLTRHKQSHNPERPYVCTVCLKAFKRKEQLTLHFVIHSGEKRHVCTECGKGFYRKDHLRKHTRSHIARRVKAELSQHAPQPQQQSNSQQIQIASVSAEQPPPLLS